MVLFIYVCACITLIQTLQTLVIDWLLLRKWRDFIKTLMIFIALIFRVKNPLLGFIILVKQYARLANSYYKHRQAETINEDNTLRATG